MAEHAALRSPGRAGRVDDLAEVVGATRRAPLLDVIGADVHTVARRLGEPVELAARDHPQVLERGQFGTRLRHDLGVLVGLCDDGDRAGVAEDPLDLFE